MAITWKKLAYESDVILKTLTSAKGDIIYASGANTPARLAIGTDNHVLTVATDVPNWEALPAAAAHKDTHDPNDGSDPLDTANAAEVSAVVAAGTGTSHSLARADHVHAINHGITNNHIVTIDDAGDAVATEYPRFTASGLESKTAAEVAATMKLDDVGVPDGAVDFDLQQATDFVVMTVAAEANLPAGAGTVAKGQLCWATSEATLHVCTAAV